MADAQLLEARSLAAAGRMPEAFALLDRIGAQGNVHAIMQQAVWHLMGMGGTRDLGRARLLLRRAVEIGHVDGALMEVALTANGTGGESEADWRAARALLQTAARHDPVAKAQCDLVAIMNLDRDGYPASAAQSTLRHQAPAIRYFPALLTPAECQHIAMAAADMLEPALIIDPANGASKPHPVRTSDGAAIGPTREDLVVQAINRRLAQASGTHVDQGEPLTVLRYRPGQQYRPHLDTIAGEKNQRIKTMIVYLNEGFVGGETVFPALDLRFRPRGGDALLFDNVLPDMTADKRSIHAGLPVIQGAKWIATRWIRAEAISPWTIGAAP